MANQIQPRSWEEFRETGLMWLINNTLHVFGWAIVVEIDNETLEVVKAYPAKVKFRGFSEEANEENMEKVTLYMAQNAENLLKDLNLS